MIGIASGSFQPVAACYGLLLVVSLVTIDDDLEICYKSTSCRFYYKVGQASLKSGDSFDVLQSRVSPITKGGVRGGGAIFHYRSGQVVLQSRPGVTKWRNFYNKVVQVLQIGAIIKSRAVQKANEINGNRQNVLATYSLIHY